MTMRAPILSSISVLALLSGAASADGGSDPPNSAPAAISPAISPAVAPAKAPRRLLRVAVYDLAVDGVDARVGKLVTDSLVVELRKLEGVSVVGMGEVRAMLRYEADKQALGCSASKSCASAIGDALGVDEIVVGELGVVAGQSVMSLRRIDQANARAKDSFTQRLASKNGEEFLALVGPGVQKLYPTMALKRGYARGVAPELAAVVNPPPLPPWATVTTGVAGGVLLAAGVVAGASALSEHNTFATLQDRSKTAPVDATLVTGAADRAQGWAATANGLYAGAVVVAVAAGVMWPFTDWSGARDARIE